MAAENNDELRVLFAVDEALDLLAQTGFPKATCSLTLDDGKRLASALIDFHCMLKVKAAMDQFKDGLKAFGLLSLLEEKPALWKPLFVDCGSCLTAGKSLRLYIHQINGMHD